MVSEEDVHRVSENARINLEDKEIEKFTSELEEIIEVFDKLDEVDTGGVEPAFHPIETKPETREDEVEDSLDKEEIFDNTENNEDGHFKGPSV